MFSEQGARWMFFLGVLSVYLACLVIVVVAQWFGSSTGSSWKI